MSEEQKGQDTGEQDNEANELSWWRFLLRYAALPVAIVGVLGAIFQEPLSEFFGNLLDPGADQQSRLVEFLKKNESCTRTPGDLFVAPNGVKIDATICSKTGDIYVAFYFSHEGREVAKYGGIFLEDAIKLGSDGIVIAETSKHREKTGPTFLIASLTRDFWPADGEQSGSVEDRFSELLLGARPTVQCQSFPDSNTIVRIINENGSCYQETIDASSGFVKNRFQVSCNTRCP